MAVLNLTSDITFLYFNDLVNAKKFFSDTLGLEEVYNPGWACVYRLKDKSFLGAVDNSTGSIKVDSTSSVLVSLTVSNIHEVYEALEGAFGVEDLSPIRQVKDMSLESFFFHGPEGYSFEVEQFTDGALQALF